MMAAPVDHETVSQRLAREKRELRARIVTPKGAEYIARKNAAPVATAQVAPTLPKAIGGMPIAVAAEVAALAIEKAVESIAPGPMRPSVTMVQRIACEHFGVTRADMVSVGRTANIVLPRQAAMYLAKTMTLCSLPEIGRRFGGRDHTTVLHAVRKMEALYASDPEVTALIDDLRAKVTTALAASHAELTIKKEGN